jgi:hypothetical protein
MTRRALWSAVDRYGARFTLADGWSRSRASARMSRRQRMVGAKSYDGWLIAVVT